MFNLGMGEITVILLLALIFLGPKKLPELASGLGKLIREIRKTTADVKNEIQLDDAIRKPFEELRDAVTLHPDELKRRDRLRQELAEIQRQAEAAVAAAEQNPATELPATGEGGGDDAPVGEAGDVNGVAASDHAPATGHPLPVGAGAADSAAPTAMAAESSRGPTAVPALPGAAPVGTVARSPAGAGAASLAGPPAPPLAAVLTKGAAGLPTVDRRVTQPPSGSDFVRSLRATPEGKRGIGTGRGPASPAVIGSGSGGAADRGNTTQALTEADLAAITVGPPPPPPASGPGGPPATRIVPSDAPSTSAPASGSVPARLPGATPPKTSNQ